MKISIEFSKKRKLHEGIKVIKVIKVTKVINVIKVTNVIKVKTSENFMKTSIVKTS